MMATIMRPEAIPGALWFMTYVFTPTQGRAYRVRLRHVPAGIPENARLSFGRFYYELVRFYLFCRVEVTLEEPEEVI